MINISHTVPRSLRYITSTYKADLKDSQTYKEKRIEDIRRERKFISMRLSTAIRKNKIHEYYLSTSEIKLRLKFKCIHRLCYNSLFSKWPTVFVNSLVGTFSFGRIHPKYNSSHPRSSSTPTAARVLQLL